MAPFRFRLARVLRVRAIEEEIAHARWLEAARAAGAAAERAERLATAHARQHEEIAHLLASSPVDPRLVVQAHAGADRAARSARAARERARTLEFHADQQRAPWEALRRARKSLELLRDKKLATHQLEEERADAHAIDAIAMERAARRGVAPRPESSRP